MIFTIQFQDSIVSLLQNLIEISGVKNEVRPFEVFSSKVPRQGTLTKGESSVQGILKGEVSLYN